MSIAKYIPKIFCSLFGIGFIKRGGASIGAVLGVIFFYFINETGFMLLFLIWAIILILGMMFSDLISRDLCNKDPQFIIIDEFIGAFTSLLFLPHYNIVIYILAIIFFRLNDRFKPFGIKKVELLGGGKGIMLDDILAGIYSNIFLRILILGIKL
ncbi:MAG: phosphatidylglycerophosphatase A [Ignavibacteria bacterium]|nr:phosphatidylglycerophosphatase A [Ignavibacteria bacterium]